MHLLEIFDLTLAHEALPSTSCALCTCKVWSCYHQWLRRCIYKKIHYLILTPRSRGSGHTKCCSIPLTSCDLCTNKVWCCNIPWLRRRCIYKKIHYLTLTLGSRSHEMLPSTLYIMWPMRLQSLKLLRQTARSHTFVEIDHKIISMVTLLPSAESFKKGCCQLQAKVCARSTD